MVMWVKLYIRWKGDPASVLEFLFIGLIQPDPLLYLRGPIHGRVAEWLGTALQKLLLRFESARDLDRRAPRFPGRSRIMGPGRPSSLDA